MTSTFGCLARSGVEEFDASPTTTDAGPVGRDVAGEGGLDVGGVDALDMC